MDEVIVVGAGIGGLTLGIALHQAGIPCRIFESAAEPRAVGINLLPHATRELAALGLEPALERVAIKTKDIAYFNRSTGSRWVAPRGPRIRSSRFIAAICNSCCVMHSSNMPEATGSSPTAAVSRWRRMSTA